VRIVIEEERMAKQATAKAESSAGKTRKRAVSKTAAQVVGETPMSRGRELSHHEIAQHAYGIYLARGAHEGGAQGDWLRAEHELRTRGG
jgi:hypothetical protein